MTTPCTVDDARDVDEGDALCVVGWDVGNARPKVARASKDKLATSKTVFGIAKTPAIDTALVDVYVAGEVVDPATVATGLDVGTGAGTSRLIVTDITQTDADPDVEARLQCRVKRIDDVTDVPVVFRQELFVVGTCDENGNLVIQPRHMSEETGLARTWNAKAYGFDAAATGADNSAALARAIGAINRASVADTFALFRGAVLELGRGIFELAEDLHITREMTVRGASVGGGDGGTVLKFAAGKGIIVDSSLTNPNPAVEANPGSGNCTIIENLDIFSEPFPAIMSRVDIGAGGTVAIGDLTYATNDNRYYFEALTAGTAGTDLNVLDTTPEDPGDTPVWPISVQREIVSTSTDNPMKIVTKTPHLFDASDAGLELMIVGADDPFANGIQFLYGVIDEVTFTINRDGAPGGPGGANGTIDDSFASDGAIIWAVRTHSGITLKKRANVRNCWIDTFTNAGVLVAAPYGMEGYGTPSRGVNANGFRLDDLRIVNCGLGVAVSGGDSSVGTGIGIDVEEPGVNLDTTGGHGIDDYSWNGCTWVSCQVATSDTGTGNSFRAVRGAVPSTFVGCYAELTMTEGSLVNRPGVMIGCAAIPNRASTGTIINSGATRNLDWTGVEFSSVGSGQYAFGDIELRQQEVGGAGPAAYKFSHSDDNADTEVYLAYKYNAKSVGGDRQGEWEFIYGALSAPRAYVGYLSQSAVNAEGGPGNWRDPHGHFLGMGSAEQIFIGPASARADTWIRGGGDPSGAPAQYLRGDQFWLPEDRDAPGGAPFKLGSLTGWIVTEPGYRGAAWVTGTYGPAELNRVVDMFQESGSSEDNPAPGTRVFQAVSSGVSTYDPSLLSFGGGVVGTTDSDVSDGFVWQFVGTVPEYRRIGKIHAPCEGRMDAETTDDQPVVLGSFTTTDDSVVTLTLTVSGCEPVGPQSGGQVIVGSFRNSGGAVAQVGGSPAGTVSLFAMRDDALWEAYFAIDGKDVQFIVVNGTGAATVYWSGTATVVERIGS